MSDGNIDPLYEGLPDDAGYFENDEGFALRTRVIKGEQRPRWVKRVEGAEKKIKPTMQDLENFKKWKNSLYGDEPLEPTPKTKTPPSAPAEDDPDEVEGFYVGCAVKVLNIDGCATNQEKHIGKEGVVIRLHQPGGRYPPIRVDLGNHFNRNYNPSNLEKL